jgi:hypothetical protein
MSFSTIVEAFLNACALVLRCGYAGNVHYNIMGLTMLRFIDRDYHLFAENNV